jgi:hypothetical protein
MFVILCAFCVGVLVSFIVTIVHSIKMKGDAKTSRRKVHQLEMELAALRNRSLEDIEKLEGSEVKSE